MQETVL